MPRNMFSAPRQYLAIDSDNFIISEQNKLSLQAHIPGLIPEENHQQPGLVLSHKQKPGCQLTQDDCGPFSYVVLETTYNDTNMPADVLHLLYGMLRKQWLEQHLCPVHAACVGTEEKGYFLLVGPAGAGKTSTALDLVLNHNMKLFSGDKTLIQFTAEGKMYAIAGTQTMTLRRDDRDRWPEITDQQGEYHGDRFVFRLLDQQYKQAKAVKIAAIYVLNLRNDQLKCQQLSHDGALHELYKYFLDTERTDVTIGTGLNKTLFDGAISFAARSAIHNKLNLSLSLIRTSAISGTRELVCTQLNKAYGIPKKVLFGVCGLGSGHTFRQLPIINCLLAEGYKIAIFAYDSSLAYFNEYFWGNPDVSIFEVADPFLVGNSTGLDMISSQKHPRNQKNFAEIYNTATDKLLANFGVPELVISDYNLASASLAANLHIRLITLDQQSKFLLCTLPATLITRSQQNLTYMDEFARLERFFPNAYKRIALSFFAVERNDESPHEVEIMAPVLRPEILALKGQPMAQQKTILVYISSMYQLNVSGISELLSSFYTIKFTVFVPKEIAKLTNTNNIEYYIPNDTDFLRCLAQCHAVIATAGHSLLSEAMYLQKPVFAIPAEIYEQQINAKIIDDNEFGMKSDNLNGIELEAFLNNLTKYKENIVNDNGVLLGGTDAEPMLNIIRAALNVTNNQEANLSADDICASRLSV